MNETNFFDSFHSERKPLSSFIALSQIYSAKSVKVSGKENLKCEECQELKEYVSILEKKLHQQSQEKQEIQTHLIQISQQNQHYQNNYTELEQSYKALINQKELEMRKLVQGSPDLAEMHDKIKNLEAKHENDMKNAKQLIEKAEQNLDYFYNEFKHALNHKSQDTFQISKDTQTDAYQQSAAIEKDELDMIGDEFNEKVWRNKVRHETDKINQSNQLLLQREKQIQYKEEKILQFVSQLKEKYGIDL